MADSENVQPKQKLSDEEKTTLINFYKQKKALWSSEVNFWNKEEKSAVVLVKSLWWKVFRGFSWSKFPCSPDSF